MYIQDDSSVADKGHALWQMLRRTDHVMYRARQRELEEYGISTEVASTIFTIVRLGQRANTKAIAIHRFLERNTVSEQLTRMEKQGLIEKVMDPDRRNRVRVILTPDGHEAFAKSVVRRSMRDIMSVLSPERQDELWRSLSKLRARALGELGMEVPALYPPSDPAELSETAEGRAIADRGHALYQLLRLTVRVIAKARQRELEQHGITLEMASALSAIARLGHRATPKLIAEQRLLERNTASDQMTRMEKQGFILKVWDLDRRNRVRIILTEKGRESLAKSLVRRSTGNIMAGLSPEWQARMWSLLSDLRARALQQLGKDGTAVYPPSDPGQLSVDAAAHVLPDSI